MALALREHDAALATGIMIHYARTCMYLHGPHFKGCPLDAAVFLAYMALLMAMAINLQIENSIQRFLIDCLTLLFLTCKCSAKGMSGDLKLIF